MAQTTSQLKEIQKANPNASPYSDVYMDVNKTLLYANYNRIIYKFSESQGRISISRETNPVKSSAFGRVSYQDTVGSYANVSNAVRGFIKDVSDNGIILDDFTYMESPIIYAARSSSSFRSQAIAVWSTFIAGRKEASTSVDVMAEHYGEDNWCSVCLDNNDDFPFPYNRTVRADTSIVMAFIESFELKDCLHEKDVKDKGLEHTRGYDIISAVAAQDIRIVFKFSNYRRTRLSYGNIFQQKKTFNVFCNQNYLSFAGKF